MIVRKAVVTIRSIALNAPRRLAHTAVHVRVYPRPRNLAESKEILHVLEQYGEVAMYKHLKYEFQGPAPNTLLAIYQSPSSAQKLIKASPFRFKLELKDTKWTYAGSEILNQAEGIDFVGATSKENEDVFSNKRDPSETVREAPKLIKAEDKGFQGLKEGQKPSTKPTKIDPSVKPSSNQALPPKGSLADPTVLPAPVNPEKHSQSSSQSTTPPIREFQLWISPSHLNHQAYIERQGYYTGFIPSRKTRMAEDLEGRVPLDGLIDCQIKKQEVPLRIRNKRRENPLLQPFSIRALWDKRKL